MQASAPQPASVLTRRAVALSIGLHAALGYAIARVAFAPHAAPPDAPHVVWVIEKPRPASAAAGVAPQVPPEPSDASEASPEPALAPDRARDAERPPDVPLATVREEAPRPPTAEPATPAAEAQTEPTAPPIDWDRERERAVARVLQDLEREQGYLTFGQDGEGDEEPAEAPNPRAKIFASPGHPGGGIQALQPGRGHSRFANRLASICNAFTGGAGLSLFGFPLGTICADGGSNADFFADIRPDYMESLPLCEESTPDQPELAAAVRDKFPTVKCRLVLQAEIEP